MELTFREESISYLEQTVLDPLYRDLSDELLVSEDLPEVERVLDTDGMVLIQNKQISGDGITVTGSILTNVLYRPQGGGELQRLQMYLPFTVEKKTKTEQAETVFCWAWIKRMDTRQINPRKLLVRACLGCELTLLRQAEFLLSGLENPPKGLQCKRKTYPMQLPLCWAERELQLTDEILLPQEQSPIARLLKWSCSCRVEESRVMGDKAVFKGAFHLDCLYLVEDGSLKQWNTDLPYSQYAELDRNIELGRVSVQPIFRTAEVETDGDLNTRRLLADLRATAQLVVWGEVPVELIEDTYLIGGAVRPAWQSCPLHPCLDVEQTQVVQGVPIPPDAAEVTALTVFADSPSQIREQSCRRITVPIQGSCLYYSRAGELCAKSFQATAAAETAPESRLLLRVSVRPEARPGQGEIRLSVRLDLTHLQAEEFRNLCGGEYELAEGGARPSLLVTKAAGDLWELAKQKESTVQAIQQANGLQSDCINTPGMILIPVGTRGE